MIVMITARVQSMNRYGSSMSYTVRSWLKRFTVVPTSVLVKNESGALQSRLALSYYHGDFQGHLPHDGVEKSGMDKL